MDWWNDYTKEDKRKIIMTIVITLVIGAATCLMIILMDISNNYEQPAQTAHRCECCCK